MKNDNTLNNKSIKRFLEEIPLYHPITLNVVINNKRERIVPTSIENKESSYEKSLRDVSIDEIDDFCNQCQKSRPFKLNSYNQNTPNTYVMGVAAVPVFEEHSSCEFKCASCDEIRRIMYKVDRHVSNGTITLFKYGQFPRKPLSRDKHLSKFLKRDKDLYEKGLICLAGGFGIAANAYFRQILEKNIDDLLKILMEDESFNQNYVFHDKSSMKDKIHEASKVLPQTLIVDGMNPLGALYKAVSENLHNGTDYDCMRNATVIKDCLTFIISNLYEQKKQKEAFKKNLSMFT